MAFFWPPGCSSWFQGFLGTNLDNTQDGSWRRCFAAFGDRLARPLHRPMAYGCRTKGQGLLLGVVLSRRYSGVVAPPGDVKPPDLDIWWSTDRVDTCATKSYME
jgi:hypothetical protein